MDTTNFTTQSFEINVLPIIKKKKLSDVNLSTLCRKRYSNLAFKKKKKSSFVECATNPSFSLRNF